MLKSTWWLLCDFEDDFELDRHAERKTGNPDDHSDSGHLAAEDIPEEIRHCIRNPRLVEEISGGRHEDAQPYDTGNSIQRTQVLLSRGKGAQGCRVDSSPARSTRRS
jgi:hypothetical protein